MPHRHLQRKSELSRMLAIEAARIMAEQSVQDFDIAKRKAAERFKIADQTLLPKNSDIQAALHEHQSLFQGEDHDVVIRELRLHALQLMQQLQTFAPHLVGSVLHGIADAHSQINLHVFAENTEQVLLHLLERNIHARHAVKKLRYQTDRFITLPSFQFTNTYYAIEIVVFPLNGIRQAPLSTVDNKPMVRANLATLRTLLQ